MVVSLSHIESVVLYVVVFLSSAYIITAKIKNRMLQIVLASLLPFLISGFRYNVGWDYGSYVWGFELFDSNMSIWEICSQYKFGDSLGLNLIQLITKKLDSKFLFLAITSALCFIPAFLYLRKEWNKHKDVLSLAIFITGFSLFFSGLSAIKQGMAMSFCLYSLTYVFQRKPIKYLICVCIAFLFHSSALIFFPIYFCWSTQEKISGWKKLATVASAFLFVIYLAEILSIFGGERFENYGTEILKTNNYSFYVMVFWLIIFVAFRRRLIEIDTRNELLILMYAIAVILMLLGFRNAFTKRIASYFSVVQIMLLPQLIFIFTKRSRRLAIVLIGTYIVLFCVIMNSGTAENMAPIPYSFLFGDLK